MVWQANAVLADALAPRRGAKLFSPVDGSGTHRSAVIARHIAVSEAIERWALLVTLKDADPKKYGFGIDPTSNGMAAFPGLIARQARRFAWLEAVERYCIFAWWEGRAGSEFFRTQWDGVSGVELRGPFDANKVKTVILFSRSKTGRYAYGYAAARNRTAACARALIELCRHQVALQLWDQKSDSKAEPAAHQNLGRIERRSLFFSTAEGFAEFWERVRSNERLDRAARHFEEKPPEILFDGEIPGPWSRYAPVWRVVFRQGTRRFLDDGERYFFW